MATAPGSGGPADGPVVGTPAAKRRARPAAGQAAAGHLRLDHDRGGGRIAGHRGRALGRVHLPAGMPGRVRGTLITVSDERLAGSPVNGEYSSLAWAGGYYESAAVAKARGHA